MRYINPYEIAKFIHVNKLDVATFKKFKRRLSAELELNDNEIIINNISFQKNEIYEILDSIDKDKSLLDIYKSLYENQKLNDFLNGQLNITDIKKLKNILFLEDKKTINFIIPYLIDIFSKLYKEAFLKNDINILEIEPPLGESHYEKIYEPIYKILKNKENELISLKDDYYDLDDIKDIVGNIKTINILPEYFTKIRSDIAYAIRNLSIDSWNDNEDLDLAIDLINYALKFKVNSKTKDKFLSDKDDLENIREEQKLIKFLDKIDNILNDTSILFSTRIDKIINILELKNSKIKNDTIALIIYNIINKYIEKNESIIKNNISSLIKIFKYLVDISNDFKLNKSLNENIDILNKLTIDMKHQKKIEKEVEVENKVDSFFGVISIISIIIGALVGVSDGGIGGLLAGGFIGMMAGGMIAIVIGGPIKFIGKIFS